MASRWSPLAVLRATERSVVRAKTTLDYKRKVDAQLRTLRRTLPAEAFRFDPAPALAFLRERFGAYRDLRWHRFYGAANGRHAAEYLPEDVFYFHVLPDLNPRDRWAPYQDKNLAAALGVVPGPRTVARLMRGRWVDDDLRPLTAEEVRVRAGDLPAVVAKPARGSGGGRDVQCVSSDAVDEFIDRLGSRQAEDWLLQELVVQHPDMAALNPDTVNTCRVLTLRSEGRLYVLDTVLRVGRVGSVVDNLRAGGLAVAVDEAGCLGQWAFFRDGVAVERHPDHGYAFAGRTVAPLRVAHEACLAVHERVPDLDLLSFDVIMIAGPAAVLLELNVGWQGVTMHQLCHGPLFGPHTDAVVRPRRVPVVAGLLV